MKIIALADIHANLNYLPDIRDELSSVDLVLIAGDITHFGDKTQARTILSKLQQYNWNILPNRPPL